MLLCFFIIIIITECHKQHLVQGLQGCTHGDTQRFNHAQSLKRASEQFTLQPPAEDRQRFGRLNSLRKTVPGSSGRHTERCVMVLCSISVMHNCKSNQQVGLLHQALIVLGLAFSPPSTSVSYLRTLWCYVSVFFVKIILTSLYLVEGLAWWVRPCTWWTDQLLSFSA